MWTLIAFGNSRYILQFTHSQKLQALELQYKCSYITPAPGRSGWNCWSTLKGSARVQPLCFLLPLPHTSSAAPCEPSCGGCQRVLRWSLVRFRWGVLLQPQSQRGAEGGGWHGQAREGDRRTRTQPAASSQQPAATAGTNFYLVPLTYSRTVAKPVSSFLLCTCHLKTFP